ncbi:MAG: alcohol dehydrogenase catalytic domain-containing protein [Oscillospiraceae bacterium]|nr:alcohol dehydrogenase catalytic domain-containing protein [Oscillospiraceae bacterium]
MKAAVLRAFHQPLSIEELPIPKPGEGEVLAKVLACGLCASDLHIADGMIGSVRLPYTPGHEICGEIVALGGGVEGFALGERFVAGIDLICGHCRFCRSGRGNLCASRVRLGFERDGGQAEYCVVPAQCVFPIASHVPPEQAAVIPDAVACMYHAMRRGEVGPGSVICVTGVGGLGRTAASATWCLTTSAPPVLPASPLSCCAGVGRLSSSGTTSRIFLSIIWIWSSTRRKF